MKTLVINGSPGGRGRNTDVICRQFMEGMQTPPEIRYVAEEEAADLAAYMEGFDHWLFFFPLYVNAMPGIVKRLFEHMRPNPEKHVGYFIQSGFEEAFQSDWLLPILKNFNRRMGYQDLGIIVAGGMGGVSYMPEQMNKKLFARLQKAGRLYEQTGAFDKESMQQFGQPYRFSKVQVRRGRFLRAIGLGNVFWNMQLKKHKAFDKRFDKPFGR